MKYSIANKTTGDTREVVNVQMHDDYLIADGASSSVRFEKNHIDGTLSNEFFDFINGDEVNMIPVEDIEETEPEETLEPHDDELPTAGSNDEDIINEE